MAKKPKTPAAPEVPAVSDQPYYLQRAHIKDFRSIRDAKVEFKPGLNIIIGANGSGKTNLLQLLTNVVPSENSDYQNSKNEFIIKGEYLIEIRNIRNDSLVDVEKILLLSNVQIDEKRDIQLTINGVKYPESRLDRVWIDLNNIRIEGKLTPVMKLPDPVFIGHGIPKHYQLVSTSLNLTVNYSNYSPDYSGVQSEYVKKLVEGILASIFFNARHHIVKLHNDLSSELIKDIVNEVVVFSLERLRRGLRACSQIEDIRLWDFSRVYINQIQFEILIHGLVLEYYVAGKWIPFDALSSGTQRMFYIISEIMTPHTFFFSEQFEKGYLLYEPSRIILLEEPELGIHPDQLHKLLQFLREQSEKHQLIITTHSPQVLDMLKEDELDRITICELDEEKGTQFRKLKKAQIATAKKYMTEVGFLSDYWRYGSLEENI